MGDTRAISDREAHLFVLAAGITDETEKSAIYHLVYSLKVNGIWDKIVALFPMVGGTALACSLNLKNINLHQITWINAPSFASTGVTGNGSNQYGSISLVPSNSLTVNNIHLSFYSRTTGSVGNQTAMGVFNTSSLIGSALLTAGVGLFSSGTSPFYGTHPTFSTLPSTAGFFIGTKDVSNNQSTYFNGNFKNSTTNPYNSSATGNIGLLASIRNGSPDYYSSQECAYASLGAHMTADEVLIYYNIIQEFQTILSRQV